MNNWMIKKPFTEKTGFEFSFSEQITLVSKYSEVEQLN